MEDERKEKILNAAIDVFAQKGFVDAKISQIADKAGVATGVIYSDGLFINKLDLLLTITLSFWQDLNDLISSKQAEQQDPITKLLGVVGILGEMMLGDNRSVRRFKVIHESIPYIHPKKGKALAAKRKAITNQNRKLLDTIDAIIEEGQRKGAFEESLDASVLRQVLFGAFELLMYGLFLKKSGREASIRYGEKEIIKAMHLLLSKFLLVPGGV